MRISGNDAKTKHSNLSWSVMLLTAGMGNGLRCSWGVAEPVACCTGWYQENRLVSKHTHLKQPKLHWVQPSITRAYGWAIYAVVALALAFFTFNKRFTSFVRSIFYCRMGVELGVGLVTLLMSWLVLATLFGLT
ncbi:BCCT family transporter [Vibrio chagasii]|nr:BCCT family transporter [Vibrio chagasii]